MHVARYCVLGLVLVALGSVSASADCGYGYGYGMFGGRVYVQDQLPFYAEFPPVYYSYPVPRTYGYSPFAYPPGVRTPEVEVRSVEPQVTFNPFVPRGEKSAPVDVSPLRIRNPFADPSSNEGAVAAVEAVVR
jgi:hypothetical protein